MASSDTNYELQQIRSTLESLTERLAAATPTTVGGMQMYIAAGWSPIIALTNDGTYYYAQILDWTGGSGIKPPVMQYLCETGWTYNVAEAARVGIVGGGIPDGDKGDITVASGVWTIDNGVVSTAKLADRSVTTAKLFEVGHEKLIGRHSAGAGDAQEIGIDGGLELQGGNLRRSALTGDVTASAGGNATTIAVGAVTTAKMGGDVTAAGKALLDDADAAAQRATLGLGTAATAASTDFAAASHTHSLSALTASGASANDVATFNGTTWVPAAPSGGAGANSQIFTTAGSHTWTNPSPATRKLGRARLIGGGPGGGSGRKGAPGTVRCGGGGGAGACVNEFWFWTDTVPASVAVTVGAGGAGGASVTTNSTNGNAGLPGTSSVFNSWIGYFGNPGQGGTNASGAGGTAFGNSMLVGGIVGTNQAGASATTNGGPGGGLTSNNQYIPTGAGAGGGITSGDSASTGGSGQNQGSLYTSAPTAPGYGGAVGVNGSQGGPPVTGTGFGGGGGGASTTGNAGNGANGNGPGGPGGGGGAATDGVGNSGAGGNGAPGLVEIVVFL